MSASAFLAEAGSVNEVRGDATWGKESAAIDFVGGPYLFPNFHAQQLAFVRTRFEGMAVDPNETGDGVLRIEYLQVAEAAFVNWDWTGREYEFDRFYESDRLLLAGDHFTAEINLAAGGDAQIHTSEYAPPRFPLIFDNTFRVIAAYRLLALGGGVLHSACVVKNGRARIVLGHCGAGKSTFSRLALKAGWEVLSDDMNAVCRRGNTLYVEKLPFAGDLGQTPCSGNSFPLAGVYVLRKGSVNRVTPISRGQLVAKAVTCSPVINEDPFRAEELLDTMDLLIGSVDKGVLEFSLDGNVFDLLEAESKHDER